MTLTKRWNVEVGTGYATPLVVGERLYVFTRQGENEVMTRARRRLGQGPLADELSGALQDEPGHRAARTGTEIDADASPPTGCSRSASAASSRRSTPPTGKQIWQRPADPVEPLYHTAMSPLVVGNQMILHVGGHDNGALTSFDVATGKVRWSWNGDGPAYGSPLLFDLSGTPQVVTFTQKYFVGVSLEDGKLLWRRPFTTPSTTTSQTPILYKNMVIQTGRDNGVTAFRVAPGSGEWTTTDVWHTDEVSTHMSDAVAIDNVLFGLSHLNSGQYFALDLDTGKVLWKSEPRQAAHAAIARAGNTIFSLEDDSELVVIRFNRAASSRSRATRSPPATRGRSRSSRAIASS